MKEYVSKSYSIKRRPSLDGLYISKKINFVLKLNKFNRKRIFYNR